MSGTEYFTRGTLGDAYIQVCKLCMIAGPVRLYHHTIHKYWYKEIRDIFSLRKETEVEFVDEEKINLPEITSDVHDQPMEFFPNWDMRKKSKLRVISPYTVLQPHSGKPIGFNEKKIPVAILLTILKQMSSRCALIGTDEEYKNIKTPKCINLIGKTNIYDCISLISRCERFVGPEGFMSFVALSYKKDSRIFYKEHSAIEKRVLGSLWEKSGIFFTL